MNIPFKPEKQYSATNRSIGNAGAGYNVNKPTIPTINYNPINNFILGAYNNNTLETLPNQFTDFKLKYHTNNPINGNDWICNKRLNGNGSNRKQLTPNQWSKYNLNDSYIPNTQSNSQTFPYNPNSSFIDGGIKRQWGGSYSVNISDNNLEQIQTRNGIVPNERTTEEKNAVNELLNEMNNNEQFVYDYDYEY
jgi:hypothetical protein